MKLTTLFLALTSLTTLISATPVPNPSPSALRIAAPPWLINPRPRPYYPRPITLSGMPRRSVIPAAGFTEDKQANPLRLVAPPWLRSTNRYKLPFPRRSFAEGENGKEAIYRPPFLINPRPYYLHPFLPNFHRGDVKKAGLLPPGNGLIPNPTGPRLWWLRSGKQMHPNLRVRDAEDKIARLVWRPSTFQPWWMQRGIRAREERKGEEVPSIRYARGE